MKLKSQRLKNAILFMLSTLFAIQISVAKADNPPPSFDFFLVQLDMYAITPSGPDLRSGVAARFDDLYNDAYIQSEDASAFFNFLETIVVNLEGQFLTLDSRNLDVYNELVQLTIFNYQETDYSFQISITNSQGKEAYLVDTFLNTFTLLPEGASTYNYSLTSDVSSQDPDRFQLFVTHSDDIDGDTVSNNDDLDDDNDGILDTIEGMLTDADGDRIIDRFDLDSDNDGIPDNIEAQLTSLYIPPNTDNSVLYQANFGVNTAYILNSLPVTDSDGDLIPDYLDMDSDNDSLSDLEESFSILPAGLVGNNGLFNSVEQIDNYADINGNAYESNNFTLQDTDADVQNGADYNYRDIEEISPNRSSVIFSSLSIFNSVTLKPNAYVNIISNNWGVLITRVEGIAVISQPVEGMIVFDTLDNTFKVNTDGTVLGWRTFKE